MAKQQEPVIRQTPDGPMREIREVFPTAWYAAGGFCLLYACAFPLYRLHHFLICAGLACAAAFVAQKLTPERVRLEPYQEPLTGDALVDELLTQGQDALQRLRSANDALADAEISANLERIETACARIFAYIRENPRQAGQIRKFMNYYLPTTLKLLTSYDKLSRQRVKGENIQKTMFEIEGMMETIAAAFEKQLDSLFSTEAMDIAADISVMESVLKQEGLSGEDMPKVKTAGAAAVQTESGFPGLTLNPEEEK